MNQKNFFVGVDLGGTFIKFGLVSSDGQIVEEHQIPTQIQDDIPQVLDRIAEQVRVFQKSHVIQGIGIGVAGLVNPENGVLFEAPNLQGWINVPVADELQKRTGFSIAVENDANVAALGEYAYGAGKGHPNMMMVTLGTGVGGGLILNGKLYQGAGGTAGEFGHMSLQKDGPVCGCGRRGCVEAFVGTKGILNRVQEKLERGLTSTLNKIDSSALTPKDISEAALKGDDVAVSVFREVGEYLGMGFGNVANLLNLSRIVVGGGVAQAGDLILESARSRMKEVAMTTSGKMIDVVPAILGNKAGILGAARLVMEGRND